MLFIKNRWQFIKVSIGRVSLLETGVVLHLGKKVGVRVLERSIFRDTFRPFELCYSLRREKFRRRKENKGGWASRY